MELTKDQVKTIFKESIEELLPAKQPKLTLTLDECAKITGIGRNKLTELIYKKDTDFPFFRVGNKCLVNRGMLCEWLDKISMEGRVL